MKKTNNSIAIFFLILSGIMHAQGPGVGIGNSDPNTSSILEVTSTTQGILIPRMSTSDRDDIENPAESLLLYNTDNRVFNYNQSLDPLLPSWKSFSPPYNEINGTSTITVPTSLNTDLVPGMTFTPAVAGNYLAQFSAEYKLIPVIFTTLLKTKLDDLLLTLDNIGIDNIDNIMQPNTNYTTTTTLGTGAYEFPANSILTPGVYYINGAGSIPGKLTLQGTANDLFIIKIKDAFNTSINTAEVVLEGGVLASNVFWIAGLAIPLGANTIIAGTLISRGAAVSIGAGSIVNGKIFTVFGAIATNNNTITNTAPGLIDFGILNSFAIFSSSGDVGNTAASNKITGDVGTDLGAIAGYGNITGTIFNSVAQNAIVTFSLYGNDIPIPSTVKTRNYAQKIVSVNLQALVAIPALTKIEVRSKVDIGTLEITNRSFSIIKLK
jgi:hypothetical protein